MQFLMRSRQHEGAGHFASARRRVEQRLVRVLPLQIIETRQREHPAAQRRVRGHVAHELAAVPDVGRIVAQSLQHLRTAAGAEPGGVDGGIEGWLAHKGVPLMVRVPTRTLLKRNPFLNMKL